MLNRTFSFFEFEKVKFHTLDRLTAPKTECGKLRDSIEIALRKLHTESRGKYFDLIDGGIQFKDYVGVIQINDVTIEVLPKLDKSNDSVSRESAVLRWHNVLLSMLKECKFLMPETANPAQLRLKSDSVLELYFEIFVKELEKLLHLGLIKKYDTLEANKPYLKGRLVFNKHIAQNALHAERFFTRHTVYNRDHKIHQILKQALIVCKKLSGASALTARINNVLNGWPECSTIKITDGTFTSINFDRKLIPYKHALFIAEMILLNYHPDLRGGNRSVLSIMFSMNNLWESYILGRLKAIQGRMSWDVTGQAGMKYWSGEGGSKKLKPDILISCSESGRKTIIDTKWKVPKRNKPEDNDLRQLLAYKLYYRADQAFLLYPTSNSSGFIVDGMFHDSSFTGEAVFHNKTELHGGLMFLNVLDDQGSLISKASFSTHPMVAILKHFTEQASKTPIDLVKT